MRLSEKLRDRISKKYSKSFTDYIWKQNLEDFITSTALEKFDTTKEFRTLYHVYELDLNVKNSELTCRYILKGLARRLIDGVLVKGTLPLLKGSGISPNGEHCWVKLFCDDVIDPTLKIIVPKKDVKKLGYKEKEIINCACEVITPTHGSFLNFLKG